MKYFFLFCIILSVNAFAQPVGNLAIYKQCIDSAVKSIEYRQLLSEKPEIQITLPSHAALLESDIREQILFHLGIRNAILFENKKEKIHFIIESAGVSYPELYRDGFLGEYYFTRVIKITGSVALVTPQAQKKNDFSYAFTDTLKLAYKDSIETNGYSLLQTSLPTEPVFHSLLEPVIVIAALGITVYLFFTTRSAK